jgi:TetR/AcrR family transcriptional repressor of nem operon
MARPRNFDIEQVLEGAVALFRARGYEGTSVPDLTERLGICRQSLYNAFGDKHGLYLEALGRYGEREVDAKLILLAAEGSPLENVRTVIRGLAAFATACPSEGCLTATAIIDTRDDPAALAVVEQHVQRLENGFRDALQLALERGELATDARPERLARALITSIYGIGLLTRLPSSGARIADAVSVLLELLDDAAA